MVPAVAPVVTTSANQSLPGVPAVQVSDTEDDDDYSSNDEENVPPQVPLAAKGGHDREEAFMVRYLNNALKDLVQTCYLL